jgi:hypothetical protein
MGVFGKGNGEMLDDLVEELKAWIESDWVPGFLSHLNH